MKNEDMEKLTFEDALQKLEVIVRELETGQIKLDDAVEAYEKAVSLKKICEEKLRSAELKIEKIEKNKDGEIVLKPFEEETADE
ncbi:MAG: exodeoxyribonuclease VII small subunit [Alphaproteobacteria bacterium]|nr:exodeoxyribonuclease VII small subunit [Alphaproteobacteria bacterium]